MHTFARTFPKNSIFHIIILYLIYHLVRPVTRFHHLIFPAVEFPPFVLAETKTSRRRKISQAASSVPPSHRCPEAAALLAMRSMFLRAAMVSMIFLSLFVNTRPNSCCLDLAVA